MGGTGEIRDLILAAAEGATGGVVALRAAGIPAVLGGFSVEIDYDGGSPGSPGVGAAVRLSIVAGYAAEPTAGPGVDPDAGTPLIGEGR